MTKRPYVKNHYPNHLKQSRGLWNRLKSGKTVETNQISGGIAHQMKSPSRMTEYEMNVAEDAGLNVNRLKGYINNY
jgi:hypothetical protein